MKKHIIYKGFHRPFPFRILGICQEDSYMIKKCFTFTDSCKYNLGDEDQLDWNKLFGVSFGIFGIHRNSARFVWRYDPTSTKIEIGAYWYINGYRSWYNLTAIDLNKKYNFKICIFDESVVFTVLDDYAAIGKYILCIDKKITDKNRYKCGIYFGGNRTAPQRIEIVEHKVSLV